MAPREPVSYRSNPSYPDRMGGDNTALERALFRTTLRYVGLEGNFKVGGLLVEIGSEPFGRAAISATITGLKSVTSLFPSSKNSSLCRSVFLFFYLFLLSLSFASVVILSSHRVDITCQTLLMISVSSITSFFKG